MPDLEGRGPAHKDLKIKELMKRCTMISQEDQAEFLLADNDWHIDSVVQLYQ